LRGHSIDDFENSFAMWSDPEVARYIGGRPSSAEEVWSRLLRYVGLWPTLGYGYWVVTERESSRFVGEVGLANFQREISPPINSPETGWAPAPWAFGRGFATEALTAALAWSDAKLPTLRTLCMISDGNSASVRVAEKVGYSVMARTEYKGAPTTLYERLRNG
jgi:RimJ/RimL family protein N-acetyltransferase